MPIFKIHHITKYEYDRPIRESVNEIKIFPFANSEQEVLSHELHISNIPELQVFNDYWSNKTGVFNVLTQHNKLVIESKLVLRTTAPSQLRINFHSGFDKLNNEVNSDLKLIELSDADSITNQSAIDEIIQKIIGDKKSVAALVERCAEYIFKY